MLGTETTRAWFFFLFLGEQHLDSDSLSWCPFVADIQLKIDQQPSEAIAVLERQMCKQSNYWILLETPRLHINGSPLWSVYAYQDTISFVRTQGCSPLPQNYDPQGRPLLLKIPWHLERDIIRTNHDEKKAGQLGFSKTYFCIRTISLWTGMHSPLRSITNKPWWHHGRTHQGLKKRTSVLDELSCGLGCMTHYEVC